MFGFVMLGQVTLAAMDEMFEAARAIMHWFGECAKVCSHFLQRLLYFTFLLFNIFFFKKKKLSVSRLLRRKTKQYDGQHHWVFLLCNLISKWEQNS